jgi:hypothetical protein
MGRECLASFSLNEGVGYDGVCVRMGRGKDVMKWIAV